MKFDEKIIYLFKKFIKIIYYLILITKRLFLNY
jgi:hypothetical protein